MGEQRHQYTRRAAKARETAAQKGGGRSSRVAGHLALAYAALAKAKREENAAD